MPKIYIALAILPLILLIIWYGAGPIQDRIILSKTDHYLSHIKTATPEQLVLLLRDGSQDALASTRSLKVINNNIETTLREAVENCIVNEQDVDVFKIYRQSDKLLMGGNIFRWTQPIKSVIDPLLTKHGY